jgi:hypothetical protein
MRVHVSHSKLINAKKGFADSSTHENLQMLLKSMVGFCHVTWFHNAIRLLWNTNYWHSKQDGHIYSTITHTFVGRNIHFVFCLLFKPSQQQNYLHLTSCNLLTSGRHTTCQTIICAKYVLCSCSIQGLIKIKIIYHEITPGSQHSINHSSEECLIP